MVALNIANKTKYPDLVILLNRIVPFSAKIICISARSDPGIKNFIPYFIQMQLEYKIIEEDDIDYCKICTCSPALLLLYGSVNCDINKLYNRLRESQITLMIYSERKLNDTLKDLLEKTDILTVKVFNEKLQQSSVLFLTDAEKNKEALLKLKYYSNFEVEQV